jgi:hypothetical protein
MNIEGVKNDSKATPLHQLPPPILSTSQEQPRVDSSSAVLDYNDILKDMQRAAPPVVQQAEEYYVDDDNDDDDDDGGVEEAVLEDPRRRRNVRFVRRGSRPKRVLRRRSRTTEGKQEPLWAKYKYGIFIVALVAAALYFLVPRLGVWLPRTLTEGKLNVLGIAIVAMTVGVSFEAGDRFVLSKH